MFKRCVFLVTALFIGFLQSENSAYLPHVLPGLAYEDQNRWEEPFFFIQMADCQFGLLTNNKDWRTEISLLEQAVVHINRLKPKFVIMCGDMVHLMPPGSAKLRAKELADYKNVVSKIDPSIPMICVCGNHDVSNTPQEKYVLNYENEFQTPHYFAFWVGGVQCLAVNSSLICDPSKMQNVYQEQYSWFQDQLNVMVEGQRPKHRFIFQHHPWFVKTYLDSDTYYGIPKVRRMPFLEMMAEAGVAACFAGHYHHNAYGTYKGIQMITTAATAIPSLSGMRIVKVYEDHFEQGFYKMKSVPHEVSL